MNSEPRIPYATHLDVKFPALEVVDVPQLVDACTDRWYNQTLCQVNGSVARLGVLQGEYHWHQHVTRTNSSSCSRASSLWICASVRLNCRAGRDSWCPKGSCTGLALPSAP